MTNTETLGGTMNNHQLLHTLWTKAVGTPGYDKEQWQELEAKLKQTEKLADGQLIEALFPDKLSIRDQFAMAALTGDWAAQDYGDSALQIKYFDKAAERYYQMADAMLEARKK